MNISSHRGGPAAKMTPATTAPPPGKMWGSQKVLPEIGPSSPRIAPDKAQLATWLTDHSMMNSFQFIRHNMVSLAHLTSTATKPVDSLPVAGPGKQRYTQCIDIAIGNCLSVDYVWRSQRQ